MDDLAARYAPMIDQMAEMYADNGAVHAQLRSLVVTREEWDDESMRGGHFWFEVSGPPGVEDDFLVDARAFDVDGATIDIIIHPVDGILNWGEWYRVPLSAAELELRKPIGRWPPASIDRHPQLAPNTSYQSSLVDESRPAMRRGVPRAYLSEVLGEPTLSDSHKNDFAFITVAVWTHGWNESKVPCTATKMVPPNREDVPDDDWFISPCQMHEHLFSQFPEAPAGTPMW